MISSTLVHTDLHNGVIPPLPFVYPHVEHLPDPRILINRLFRRKPSTDEKGDELDEKAQPKTKGGFMFYFWMLIRFLFEGTERNMLLARGIGVKAWFGRLLWTGLQGAGLGILLGFPAWCLAILICGPIWKMDNMGNKWAPQAIKGIYGGLFGLYSNPIIATIALGAQSEHHLLVVPVDDEAAVEGAGNVVTAAAPIHPIPEEDTEHLSTVAVAGDSRTPTPGAKPGPPSPFLRPYRLASTGHSTPAHFRVGEPSDSPPALLTPLRKTRSRGSSISRPPITCNVSQIGALPAGATTPSATPARPTRPRGLTASSYVSASGSSFTYALGGTGGRACRSRSNTVTSFPALDAAGPGAPSPAASARLDVAGSPIPPQPAFVRGQRTKSDTGSARPHSPPQRRKSAQELSTVGGAGESDFDVFGSTTTAAGTYHTAPSRVNPAVPQVTIQRPSVDVDRSELGHVRRPSAEIDVPTVDEERK